MFSETQSPFYTDPKKIRYVTTTQAVAEYFFLRRPATKTGGRIRTLLLCSRLRNSQISRQPPTSEQGNDASKHSQESLRKLFIKKDTLLDRHCVYLSFIHDVSNINIIIPNLVFLEWWIVININRIFNGKKQHDWRRLSFLPVDWHCIGIIPLPGRARVDPLKYIEF